MRILTRSLLSTVRSELLVPTMSAPLDAGVAARGRGGRRRARAGRGAGAGDRAFSQSQRQDSLGSRISGMFGSHNGDRKRVAEDDSTEKDGEGPAEGTRPARRPREHTAEKPSHVSDVSFKSLAGRLDPQILSSIPFSHMTAVQAATFKPIMSGNDVLAKAKTGTGKTIAFLVPMIQRLCTQQLSKALPCPISVLILCPTRELALQTEKEANMLLRAKGQTVGVQHCIGGTTMSTEQQRLRTARADILVATPGRLNDHIQNSDLKEQLSKVKVLVLDEADRMLDMGFRPALQKITAALPAIKDVPRQTLLFSATISEGLSEAAQLRSGHAVINTVPANEENTHEHVEQSAIVAPHNQTYALMSNRLLQLLEEDPQATKVMVFLPTAKLTAFVSELLRSLQRRIPQLSSLPVMETHSHKSQSYRTKVNKDFAAAQKGVLVSSDVTARGIDFPGVTHVLQVGMPESGEQYIHRLGRTARAGAEGAGTLILTPYEKFFLQKPEIARLPISVEENPQTPSTMQEQVSAALLNVEDADKARAYQSCLGYYKAMLKTIGWTPADLVNTMNDFAQTALQYQGGKPGTSPPILAKTVGKMGLKGQPGLNVVKMLPWEANDSGTSTPVNRGVAKPVRVQKTPMSTAPEKKSRGQAGSRAHRLGGVFPDTDTARAKGSLSQVN